MKLFLKIFCIFVVIIMLAVFFFMRELYEVKNLTINDVSPTTLSDGEYRGKSNLLFRSNELIVTVKEHKIIKIDIVRDAMVPVEEFRLQVYPKLFKVVIEKQTTKIDVVSGATVTTKQYLKSIDNALNK